MDMNMSGTFVGSVVLSGLCIVFLALVLLILFVWLMAKVFDAVRKAKSDKTLPEKTEKPAVTAPAPAPAVQTAAADSDDEVIAVIAAAVAAVSEECGTPLRIKSISRSSRRGVWGNAAAAENTRSF